MLELLVAAAVVKLLFDEVALEVELLQAVEVAQHRLFEDLQHEQLLVGRIEVLDLPVEEALQYGVLVGGNGDQMLEGEDDTDRHGDEDGVDLLFELVEDGRVDEDEADVFLAFVARAFVDVEGVGQKVERKIELLGHFLQFLVAKGRRDVDPAARFERLQLGQLSIHLGIVLDHTRFFAADRTVRPLPLQTYKKSDKALAGGLFPAGISFANTGSYPPLRSSAKKRSYTFRSCKPAIPHCTGRPCDKRT